MKKIFTAVALLMFSGAVMSQEAKEKTTDTKRKFVFGVETGVNLNSFARAGYSTGFRIGGTVSYGHRDIYSIRGGLFYSQNGGAGTDQIVYSAIPNAAVTQREFLNRDVALHSVEVPLTFHIIHPSSVGKDIYPELFAGIVYDAVVFANETRDELWYSKNNLLGGPIRTMLPREYDNVTADYKTHMFSTVLGTNLYFKVSPKFTYYLGAEYKIGAHNIRKVAEPYAEKMRASRLGFKIGLQF